MKVLKRLLAVALAAFVVFCVIILVKEYPNGGISSYRAYRAILGIIAGTGIVAGLWKGGASDNKTEESHSETIGSAFSGKGQSANRRKLIKALNHYENSDNEKALRLLGELEEKCSSSEDYAAVYAAMGFAHSASGNSNDAIRFYRNSLAHRPGYSRLWSNLCSRLSEKGDHVQAAECGLKAVEYNSTNPYAYNNLATSLYRCGRYEEVIPYALKALELMDNLYTASNVLCLSYARLGDKEKSDYYYNKSKSTPGCNVAKLDSSLAAVIAETEGASASED